MGPGGQGKTRLAHHFIGQQAAQGWTVGFLRPDSTGPNDAGLDLTPLADTDPDLPGVLLVIDYAETRTAQLRRLLSLLWNATDTGKVRLLLLARGAGRLVDPTTNRPRRPPRDHCGAAATGPGHGQQEHSLAERSDRDR